MKRCLDSEHSFHSNDLKRQNSSLFSIATMMDADKEVRRVSSEILVNSSVSIKSPDGFAIRQLSISSPVPATEEGSTTINDDSGVDFFIEDDDDDDVTKTTTMLTPFQTIVTPAVSQNNVATTIMNPNEGSSFGDLKTGLVFESASHHEDPHNRLHKERAIRVTSIQDTLQKAGYQDRCAFVQDENGAATTSDGDTTPPEMSFLQDEDYLRVHLPGYMKRLDRLSGCNCQDTLDREAQQYQSIYFTKDSALEAKKAAASLCRLVSKVVLQDEGNSTTNAMLNNGFAVIRPPGHHAEQGCWWV